MPVVVYRAHPGHDLTVALRVLGEAGLNPTAIDRPDPILRHLAGSMLRVRIVVPEEEEESARAVIEKWQADTVETSKPHVAEFNRDLRDALVVTVVAAAVAWVFDPGFGLRTAGIVLGVGFLGLILAGRVREWRRRRTGR